MSDADRAADPTWRLDAVALSAAVAVVGLTAGVLQDPNHSAVRPVVTALGYALAVLPLAAGVLLALYVARRGWLRLAVRASGWLILTAATAVTLDRTADRFQPLTAYGPGGSIGALMHIRLAAAVPAGGIPFLLAGLWASGVLLTADNLVWAVLAGCGRVLLRFNRLVERVNNRILTVLGKLRPKPREEVVTLTPAEPTLPASVAEIPIISHTAPPAPPVSAATPALKVFDPEPGQVNFNPTVPPNPDDTFADYQLPSLDLLADADGFPIEDHETALRERAALLEKTFAEFAINIKVVGIHTGPVITQYELALETGLRLNKVTTLSDDIALKLKVPSVRIVAPLPGRDTVGIEVPNDHRQTVRLKELIQATTAQAAKLKLPIFLGKDVEGRPLVVDMIDMPHLLIAGRTGTGKSVCLNAVLQSFLFTRRPDECRLILIDPKQVEFSGYANLPHLMHPVVTKSEKAEAILAWAVDKMEERYSLFSKVRVRNIIGYNELTPEEILARAKPADENELNKIPLKMPYVVIVIDEVGDLLMAMKKEVESHIIRLAQKSRAAGIHLILATQRPTVDVVTGLIKSNLPARICFQVASRSDSAVVLDEKGAEKLLGRGDMLFLKPGTSTILRGQGTYVDDREIERVTAAVAWETPNYDTELLNVKAKTDGPGGGGDSELSEQLREKDEMYEAAIDIVVREQRGSTSLLQRALGIGYGRASRLIDFMAEDGIVGGFNGSNARSVLLTQEEWQQRKQGTAVA